MVTDGNSRSGDESQMVTCRQRQLGSSAAHLRQAHVRRVSARAHGALVGLGEEPRRGVDDRVDLCDPHADRRQQLRQAVLDELRGRRGAASSLAMVQVTRAQGILRDARSALGTREIRNVTGGRRAPPLVLDH